VQILEETPNNTVEYTAPLSVSSPQKRCGDPASMNFTLLSNSKQTISRMKKKYAMLSKSIRSIYDKFMMGAPTYTKILCARAPIENTYVRYRDRSCDGALNALITTKNASELQERYGSIECRPIGIVHSPFRKRKNAPNQGKNTNELSTIEIYPEYFDGLLGLSENDPIFILCWFDQSDRDILQVIPHGGHRGLTGVFATRAPNRPNPISLTLVTIVSINGTNIKVRGLEAINETPVLDMKPYYEGIDIPEKCV
jgi:tRNA-Thr(GGU) m(6)t(6)A37 methyltransferase TsaA